LITHNPTAHAHEVCYSPRDYVTQVTLRGETVPFVELVSIERRGTYDFDLPRSRYVVRVRDSETGVPLANADVTFENAWESERHGKQNVFFHAKTGEKGEAVLPPLRPGIVRVSGEAKGYRQSDFQSQPVENDVERTIDIMLQPIGETATIKIHLPDGTSAAGAQLLASSSRDDVLWRGECGPDGSIDIPLRHKGALLLVRHSQAAGMMRVWDGTAGEWRMPLRVTAWIDGQRLMGNALAFFAWAPPIIGRNGAWIARNLPQRALRLLVSRRADPAAIASGVYDVLATTLNYPWPEPAIAQPVD